MLTFAPFAEFDRWFAPNGNAPSFSPAIDVVEDQEKIALYADLPGVPQSEVEISVDKGTLILRGARKLEHAGGERLSGRFVRSFKLPPTVNVEKISASMKDGVLTLTLPKKAEAQPRQIKVSVQS